MPAAMPYGLCRLLSAVVLTAAVAWPASAQPAVPACESVPGQVFDRPIHDRLPIHAGEGEAVLARFALPYAMMASDVEDRELDTLAPFGFVRGPESDEILADLHDGSLMRALINGFHATVYFHCREKALVVVPRAVQDLDPRDWISGVVRQLGSGEDPLALHFFDTVVALYPDYDVAVAGLSAAGAVASYIGGVRNVPSVVINPSRTEAAFLNSGREQLIVIVAGDVISDPLAPPAKGFSAITQAFLGDDRQLPGRMLRLEPVGDWPRVSRLHQIDVVISELEAASE